MTLNDLFGPALERGLSGTGAAGTLEKLKQKMAEALPDKRVDPRAAVEAVLAKMSELLHIEVSTIIGAAFSQSEFLQNYLNEETLGLSESIGIALTEHLLESSHHPSVDLALNAVPIGTIGVDVDLELAFEGLVLNLEGWKLAEINPGACTAAGTISCLGIVLAERDVEPFELPKSMHFAEGLSIGRPR